jgi:hypothetical protein
MSETNAPKVPPASPPTHQAQENRDLGKAADVTKRQQVQPGNPDATKAADLKKLETLQGEYNALKTNVEKSAKTRNVDGEGLARKGDLTREIDALKRKYDLP